MGSTIHSNARGSGIVVSFPDVCSVPSVPGGAVPIPYPNTAASTDVAPGRRVVTAPKRVATKARTSYSKSSGDEAGRQRSIATLRSRMGQLHQEIRVLPADRPERWQAKLQEYLVTASELYRVQNPEE
jgi:hypothetical protein